MQPSDQDPRRVATPGDAGEDRPATRVDARLITCDLYCLRCGYNLRGLSGDPVRCPECAFLNPLGDAEIPAALISRQLKRMETAPASCVACVLAFVFLIPVTWFGRFEGARCSAVPHSSDRHMGRSGPPLPWFLPGEGWLASRAAGVSLLGVVDDWNHGWNAAGWAMAHRPLRANGRRGWSTIATSCGRRRRVGRSVLGAVVVSAGEAAGGGFAARGGGYAGARGESQAPAARLVAVIATERRPGRTWTTRRPKVYTRNEP